MAAKAAPTRADDHARPPFSTDDTAHRGNDSSTNIT
jgi:hypothetical protein